MRVASPTNKPLLGEWNKIKKEIFLNATGGGASLTNEITDGAIAPCFAPIPFGERRASLRRRLERSRGQ